MQIGKYERKNVSNSFGFDWLCDQRLSHSQIYKRIRHNNGNKAINAVSFYLPYI